MVSHESACRARWGGHAFGVAGAWVHARVVFLVISVLSRRCSSTSAISRPTQHRFAERQRASIARRALQSMAGDASSRSRVYQQACLRAASLGPARARALADSLGPTGRSRRSDAVAAERAHLVEGRMAWRRRPDGRAKGDVRAHGLLGRSVRSDGNTRPTVCVGRGASRRRPCSDTARQRFVRHAFGVM